jgi:hypothetical protein
MPSNAKKRVGESCHWPAFTFLQRLCAVETRDFALLLWRWFFMTRIVVIPVKRLTTRHGGSMGHAYVFLNHPPAPLSQPETFCG